MYVQELLYYIEKGTYTNISSHFLPNRKEMGRNNII
mgnify:FL=1